MGLGLTVGEAGSESRSGAGSDCGGGWVRVWVLSFWWVGGVPEGFRAEELPDVIAHHGLHSLPASPTTAHLMHKPTAAYLMHTLLGVLGV